MESIEDSLSKDLLSVDESDSDDLEAEYVHISEEEEFLQVPDQPAIEPVPAQVIFSYFLFLIFKSLFYIKIPTLLSRFKISILIK